MVTYVVFFLLMIVQLALGNDPTLNYTCSKDGVATIDKDKLNMIYILVNETEHTYCKPTFENLTNCFDNKNIQRPSQLKVLYEVELNPKIVGGKQPYYFNLKCEDGPRKLNASATFNQTKYDEKYNSKSKNVPWNAELKLKISKDATGNTLINGDIQIGQELYLLMSVKANYKISPEFCVAKPTGGNGKDDITMWNVTTDGSCNTNDPALIEDKWNDTNGQLSIKMYGFRFVKSESVTITCSVIVCSVSATDSCKQVCVNHQGTHQTRRRRRNAITKSTYSEKSASVSYRIETRVNANGSKGLTLNAIVYPFVVSVWMIWMERHALF